MEIRFEEIRDEDLPEVKKIYDWFVANSTATFHTEPISLDKLKEFLYPGHSVYKSYLLFADPDIAGYCFLTYHKKRQAYDRTAEVTVYLKPEFCKKGIGQVALGWLEKIAAGAA